MSHRDISEVEPQGTAELPAASKALFLETVRESNLACQSGDFARAVALYSEALRLDPANQVLFSNRSAALLKMGRFSQALRDATTAREIDPSWPKAYYRQGVALQCLGRHAEALAAFSCGLAQDPKSTQLLAALVEASMKSPLKATLEPTLEQLEAMKLDKSPFVIISVVGQELLAAGQYAAAVAVLEAALRIGTCSLKLRGSVFSALSSAYWALNSLDKAISYMQQDLAVAKSLGDIAGECRAHGNLGSAYFSKGAHKEALTAHRYQLVLAMKCKDTQAAAAALTSLGHVYTAIGDYPNALASHKQCVQLVKQMGDRLQEAREIGNVGAVYLAMGEFESAVDCHARHLRLATRLGNQVEEARAYSNLGSSHHYRRNFGQAIAFHENVLRIARELGDKAVEARAYAGLGHAARCAGDLTQAKHWHERQLHVALCTRDKMAEGRACSNLGIVYHLLGEHQAALKLHQAHLTIARALSDRAGMGRAYGNIGNAYSALGYYEQAIKYHKQELTISKEVGDRSSEASTHGNLAVAYQAIGAHEMAVVHYRAHLSTARELKDTAGEACALLNLGNCLSSRAEFANAVPFYENYLMLSQELHDIEGESKACHFLGYAHYCLGNYREAVRYYDQDLALAKDLEDKMNLGRAYCNLGLAHLALGNTAQALDCQKYFLAIAHMMKHLPGKFRALGNIGDVLVRIGDIPEAVKMYHRQLSLARQAHDRNLEASAYAALGLGHRLLRCFDKALGYHTQELTLRQEMGDLKGECRAHGHLGAVHMALGNYTNAIKCYQEQLDRAKELKESAGVEAQALGNLGIARLNMGHYEEAIGYLEQQLATLEQLSTTTALFDKGRAFGNLGDCYDALGDFEEAIKCHEQHLSIALKLKSPRDQERAYRGLGHAHRCLGQLQQAVQCLEKRLVSAAELQSEEAKAQAYGELAEIHRALAQSEQALACLHRQQAIARELKDRAAEADASSGLGQVYQQLGEYNQALRHHSADLEIAEELGSLPMQARACGHLGLAYEALGNLNEAARNQERHLTLACQTDDRHARVQALASLGRIYHSLGKLVQAVTFLEQGLTAVDSLGSPDDEAALRLGLGLALWDTGALEASRLHLETVLRLLESRHSPVAHSGSGTGGGSGPGGVLSAGVDSANAGASGPGPSSTSASATALMRWPGTLQPPRPLRVIRARAARMHNQACQALQRVLVALGRQDEALLVAEWARTSHFRDVLWQRSEWVDSAISTSGQTPYSQWNAGTTASNAATAGWLETPPRNLDQLLELVSRQKACVLYYSIAAGKLHGWALQPGQGIVRFHEASLSECSEREALLANEPPPGAEEIISPPPPLPPTSSSSSATSSTTNPSSVNSNTNLLERWLSSITETLILNGQNNRNNDDLDLEISSNTGFNSNWNQNMNNDVDYPNDRLDRGASSEAAAERSGFLRMVNRNHLYNSSNYSLSSLFSLGSVGGSVASGQASRPGSTRSRRRAVQQSSSTPPSTASLWQDTAASEALYRLLVAPFEEYLPQTSCGHRSFGPGPHPKSCPARREVVLILEGALFLVPFAVLRTPTSGQEEYLCERFSLMALPSLGALRHSSRPRGKNHSNGGVIESGTRPSSPGLSALVVGSPRLPPDVSEQYSWSSMPAGSQTEAVLVAEMLQGQALLGAQASKDAVLQHLPDADCVHVACHVSWRLASLVLSPATSSSNSNTSTNMNNSNLDSTNSCDPESLEVPNNLETPPLSEFLLTSSELLALRLNARLVVLSPSEDIDRNLCSLSCLGEGTMALARALLSAGAHCVLVSLWPVPEAASRILLRAFYSALLQGARVSRALREARTTVQHTQQLSHPVNWAGFVLVGRDLRLADKVALMGQALCELLKQPDKCRDALRVTLHLVEKSLQRIHRGQKNAMYTTQRSIEHKVGNTPGWKELLMSVGFRFEPAANGIPASVFFPQTDPDERLAQCSASLQALLGLTSSTLHAISKFLTAAALSSNAANSANSANNSTNNIGESIVEDLIAVVRHAAGGGSNAVITTTTTGTTASSGILTNNLGGAEGIELIVGIKLWRVPGCHELLASLGFDLLEVGQDEVTLRTGKQANRRNIQFVHQALLALFDTQEAPRSLSMGSSSSLESLASLDERPVASSTPSSPDDEPTPQTTAPVPAIVASAFAPPRPTPTLGLLGHRSTGGAFTSYVRRRGEPDGGASLVAHPQTIGTGLNLSNTNNTSGTSSSAKLMGRPGGGESDAAFTPSPPVALQAAQPHELATLTLAHQTRIRTLYSSPQGQELLPNPTCSSVNIVSSTCGPSSSYRRPDSSSSASSATDWEGNGLTTVVRRRGNPSSVTNSLLHSLPAFPPPRPTVVVPTVAPPGLPMVDSLHPLPPCDPSAASAAVAADVVSTTTPKFHSQAPRSLFQNTKINNGPPDRLSIRTELSTISRIPKHSSVLDNPSVVVESSNVIAGVVETNVDTNSSSVTTNPPSNSGGSGTASTTASSSANILQLRRLNRRELAPTISEVYHERNIGLGLAPPLSQLLLPTLGNHSGDSTNDSETETRLLLDQLTLGDKNSGKSNQAWLSSSALQQFQEAAVGSPAGVVPGAVVGTQPGGSSSPFSELSRRDEGDGRSIAESQCSAGSFKKLSALFSSEIPPPSRLVAFLDDAAADLGPPPPPPRPRVRNKPPPPPPPPPPMPESETLCLKSAPSLKQSDGTISTLADITSSLTTNLGASNNVENEIL